jgi:hypothetical protein
MQTFEATSGSRSSVFSTSSLLFRIMSESVCLVSALKSSMFVRFSAVIAYIRAVIKPVTEYLSAENACLE